MILMPSDEVALLNDSRYKSFIATLEKVLKQFEYSSEWADLITNLVKVKKTIESYPKFQSIPKRITLSKRLAQCLHPALPSGVHLKTLEVYETIFRMIGKRNLQRDLILYTYGLFPLLPAAALPVKPVLLNLYETYFLPLGDSLNPILTGFFLGLFPALEEGADYYDRIYALLDNLANRIDKFYFYTCIWSSIHLIPTARYPALAFILNHFDKRKSMDDQLYLMGSSVETMVSAVCTCLQDSEQSLVQRSILDFLLACLPMHNKQLTKIDMMKIITVSLYILLKRDMSLNRRIYAWFLGTEQTPIDGNSQQQQQQQGAEIHTSMTSLTVNNDPFDSSSYFIQYTQDNLVQALLHALESICTGSILLGTKSKPTTPDGSTTTTKTTTVEATSSTWTLTKLLRVLIILVDKPDVGPNILESVLMAYLLIVYQQVYLSVKQLPALSVQEENNRSETLKTLNMLLDTFEPFFIWEFLTKTFDTILNEQTQIIHNPITIEHLCGIINMLLDIASLESSSDIQSEHLPEMLYRLIKIININIVRFKADQITLCIQVLLKILKKVVPTDSRPPSIFRRSTSDDFVSSPEQQQQQQQNQGSDDILDDSTDDEDDEVNRELTIFTENDYATDVDNKLLRTDRAGQLQDPIIIAEQQRTADIERLLRRLVRTVEKEFNMPNNRLKNDENRPPFNRQPSFLSKTILQSMNHLEKSLTIYKIFFHRFVSTFLFDTNQLSTTMEKFKTIHSITEKKTDENIYALFNRHQQQSEFQLKLNDNVEDYRRAFDDCCKLLIELCCFPRQLSSPEQSLSTTRGKTDFDDWSTDLCVLSVCESGHFPIQTIAISVLIELLGYSLCLNPVNEQNKQTNISSPETIAISPSFTTEQVNLLIHDTLFFQHITAYLWEYLSDIYPRQFNVKASRLLSMLHSMLPNGDCEDLISNQLSSTSYIHQYENELIIVEAYRRFFKLWNATRDLPTNTTGRLTKTFERCLLIVLGILNESNNHCLKSMVQQWTCDCFVHGDISRIFDILLIMLLHPDTARISVQRLHPVAHKDYFNSRQQSLLASPDRLSTNTNSQSSQTRRIDEELGDDVDDLGVGDINEITFPAYGNNSEDDDDDDTYDDDDVEAEESDEEKRICAISCTDTGEVVYHLKQSSPQPVKSSAMKPPTTLSLSQPTLSNSRPVSPTTSSKGVKRRAPTMPTVYSRNTSSLESNNKNETDNNRRMYTSLHEESSSDGQTTAGGTDSSSTLGEVNLLNPMGLATITGSRRPHSVGPIPHAMTVDGISDNSIPPLSSLSESDFVPNNNNNATKKLDSIVNIIDRSRKIDVHLAYLLLYNQPYDYNRIMFAFNLIESLIDLIPKQLVQNLLTTNNIQSSSINIHNNRLHELFTRHRRGIEGRNFYSTIDSNTIHQPQSYLHLIIQILLTFTRSYYPKNFDHRLDMHDIQGNRKVHIRAMTLLTRICHDLCFICMNTGVNMILINYIHDLFHRISFQKTILHLFNTLIEQPTSNIRLSSNRSKTLTKLIFDYNIEYFYDELNRQYLRQLVQLLEQIVLLENIFHYHFQQNILHEKQQPNQSPIAALASNVLISISSTTSKNFDNTIGQISLFNLRSNTEPDLINLLSTTKSGTTTTNGTTANALRYIDNQPIVNQSLFLSSILQYLKQIDFIENHRYIISLVTRSLPHFGSSLKSISCLVVEQMCRNLCFIVQTYNQESKLKTRFKQLPHFDVIDYIIHLIQRLAYICHFCLLGNVIDNGPQILNSQYWMKNISLGERDLSDARQSILNQLPSVLSSLLFIWKTISEQFLFDNTIDQTISTTLSLSSTNNIIIWPTASVKQIRQSILEFLASLIKSNGVSFILAVAQCWGERKRQQRAQQRSSVRSTIITMPRDSAGEAQALIDIVMNIHGYTLNEMIPNMNELIRNQLTMRDKFLQLSALYNIKLEQKQRKKHNYDVWCLQFLLAYLQHQNYPSVDCWLTLAVMFKDCLAQPISPPATFLIMRILSFYIKQSPSLVERRDLKDLQDITMRVLDNCNTIVASSLEQTTWLRKNLQVRVAQPDTQSTRSGASGNQTTPAISASDDAGNVPGDDAADFDGVSQAINPSDQVTNSHYSLLALSILAEHAATLLDIVYNRTDEKDRVVLPFLQNLVTNVIPYVRTHVAANALSYRSASALLMNISQYPYTRKAWKKEAFEQLFDIGFFQLDILALRSWKIIVDNLITNERPTSFRDVMTKMNAVQTGLFVSKEHEYEQRAMLVKRFAFVIYASEKDQYNRQLPEILERIADLLKLPQVPVLHTQMFLFLRVLLLRISTRNLISLWPILMSELIQILLQLEQDLLSDLEGEVKSHVQRMAINDVVTTSVASTTSSSNPALKMYLYACKLLDVLLAMPYSELYHFQLFRSAFVSDEDAHTSNARKAKADSFIAFSARLAKLLDRKLQTMPTIIRERLPQIKDMKRPLLRLRSLNHIVELLPFFNCLNAMHTYDHHHYQHPLPRGSVNSVPSRQEPLQSSSSKSKESKKKNKSTVISSRRTPESTTNASRKEETMSEIETSVLEDFVESWT